MGLHAAVHKGRTYGSLPTKPVPWQGCLITSAELHVAQQRSGDAVCSFSTSTHAQAHAWRAMVQVTPAASSAGKHLACRPPFTGDIVLLQVSKQQICTDLATPPLEWDQPFRAQHFSAGNVAVSADPYAACEGSHAIAVMTEWDEFRGYNWDRIYSSMVKPAFVFDGR